MSVDGILGSMSERDLDETFAAHWTSIAQCYEAPHRQLSFLGGTITIHVRLSGGGTPERAFVATSDVGHYGLERCIEKIVQQMRFAAPIGALTAEFDYPIAFKNSRAVGQVELPPRYLQDT